MINYAKEQSGIFCPGQTFTIGSESQGLLPNDLDHLHLTGTYDLISQMIEFRNFITSISCLENDSN